MLPYAGRNLVGGNLIFFGSADRYLGMLCSAMCRWSEAQRHFDAAVATNTRTGALALLVHTLHDYATMLLARNAPRDWQQAAVLLRECQERERELGMRGLEHRAASLLTSRAELVSEPAAVDDLTSREIEVLGLLAIGRSNADIAMVLEISLNTVATHVRNILAKTGCANRTEAAAYAMRHRLSGAIH
jgi:DNA-binding NarL/FixJ family response regulator